MIQSVLAQIFAQWIVNEQKKWAFNPVQTQQKVLEYLIKNAQNTLFGKEHHFKDIKNHQDFRQAVPLNDYEDLRSYIDKVVAGEQDILWKGKPVYFAKTSGTTSGIKYIPISKESIPYHINAARNALLNYIHESKNTAFFQKKLIFLSGSPELSLKNGIHVGRLSGIVNHHVPNYLRRNQLPSYPTNCIEDWEKKLDKIIDETLQADMSLISGIPPWVQMYFDKIEARTSKKIKDVFPNFSVFVHGGVNFEPYSQKLYESIGKKIDTIETYPASEGFIAYQDSQHEEGLLLLLNGGIFYEFVAVDEFDKPNARRLSISEVEIGVNYAIIMNTNAGLWGYVIGDTVRFVSRNPYRIVVTGRIKHFISAFGEHVIGSEVEKALHFAVEHFAETQVVEFTVAPQVSPVEGLPYHEWFVAFATPPKNLEAFAKKMDEQLRRLNIYYDDLIRGSILRPLVLRALPEDAFIRYMKAQGKLGGQNKVPRLANNRLLADELSKMI